MSIEDAYDCGVLADPEGGGQEALASAFSRCSGRLKRMVSIRLDARLRGRVSTSDVMQEAYIDALQRLRHYRADPAVPFFVWLRSVTIQRLVQVHRQHLGAQIRSAAREVSLGQCFGPSVDPERMAELMAETASPSQVAEQRELMVKLHDALEKLDPIDREVLALRHFEELTNQEAAALLGIQTAAASKRYVRALERLKNQLEGQTGFMEAVG